MSFQWPVGKVELINSALIGTGDTPVAVADDGSDQWAVASQGYESSLAILAEESNWGFATIVTVLAPSPIAPTDKAWDTAYPLPADLVHVVWVRVNRYASPSSNTYGLPALYDILNGQLVVNAQGGPPPPLPPVTPATVEMKYVSSNNIDPTNATPLFNGALQCFVMSAIYRGRFGDTGNADKLWAAGEMFAQKARTRYDQQKPKRQLWNSQVMASRRMRHPWYPMGNNNWGGTRGGGY